MIKLKPLIISLAISLGVGIISGLITMNSMELYKNLILPLLSPPPLAFPIVWSILFILMGISAYMIYMSESNLKKKALTLYGVQLAVNFIWPILFFNLQNYLFAFIWLIILWVLVLAMIIVFYKIKPLAGLLQIPYLLWLTFAGYLNILIYLLNM